MTQQQTQSQSQAQAQSQGQAQSRGDDAQAAKDASLSSPAKPDASSPYEGPGDAAKPKHTPERVADHDGPEQMEQPYFSEAQSTLGAFEPTERVGDRFAQPEDALGGVTAHPAEQPSSGSHALGPEFTTASGTVRAGMVVVDSYGHTIGLVASVEGERLRLSSTDPHDDGIAFLPVNLIDGVDGDRVLLAGRGDASFGMPSD